MGGEDGRGWLIRVPQEIHHFSGKMSVRARYLITFILMKDHFIGNSKILFEKLILLLGPEYFVLSGGTGNSL